MRYINLLAYANLFLLLLAFVAGLAKIRSLDTAAKIYCTLMALTLAEESLAYYWAVHFHHNIEILRVFNLIEIVMLSLYFNYSIRIFRKYNVGIHIGMLALLVGIANIKFSAPISTLSGFFMYFEGVIILSMALFALFQMVRDYPYLELGRFPHFWLAVIQVFFWCSTMLLLSLYNFFTVTIPAYQSAISYALFITNYLCYAAIIIVFLKYPKITLHV